MALTPGQRVTYTGPASHWNFLCPGTTTAPQGTVQDLNSSNNPGDTNVIWDVPAGSPVGTQGALSVYPAGDPNLVYVTASAVSVD